MSARPISEREWLKGAQGQAEDWYNSAIRSTVDRVKACREALDKAERDQDDLIRRRAEMRESFARMWAGES